MQGKQEIVNTSDRAYQVYALIDPRDELVYYVGVSVNAHVRFAAHLRNGNVTSEKLESWITELMEHHLSPTLHILEEIEANDNSYTIACEKELYWIEELARSGNPLLNIAGVTRSYSPFTRVRHRRTFIKTSTSEVTEETSVIEPSPQVLGPKLTKAERMSEEEKLFSVNQVAKRLGVHKKTVLNWIHSGDLVAFELGRGFKIAESDLKDFMRRRRTDQKSPDDKD